MFENQLNKDQFEVVQNGDGPCLVLAGAGSGKTRTITYRVAYLLSRGIDPKNILLVTFTNKAAKEMIDRVGQITDGNTKLPWSGTFHHIAYRILKKYAPLLKYQNNFTILDSGDSLDLIKLCLKQKGIDRKTRRFPSAKILQAIISYARNANTTIEDVLDLKYPKWLDIANIIKRIAEDYRKRKRDANAMDFDDLLVGLYLLLSKSEKVRKKYAEQFEYVLVDEYQDTNKIQAEIIKLFASYHKNILVVGDDAQSIYSFRAADIQNILDFEKEYPDAKIFRLETNYRSTPNILEVANQVIENNVEQYKKNLKSVTPQFAKPELRVFADGSEEAEFIAERILELRDEDVPMKDIAVLFRASYHSQALEMELMKRDIQYDYRGGIRFFERAHIKDVLAYLRIFSNKDDAIAWSRVLNMQIGIGPVAAQEIIEAISQLDNLKNIIDIDLNISPRAQIGWNDFLSIWKEMENSDGSPSELIQSVMGSKYKDYLENEYPDAKERLQDLQQLALFAEKQNDLATFLAEASLQENYTRSDMAMRTGMLKDNEKIILSTIHQAKGLEWQAVFIMHAAAGHFPNERALREDNGLEEERRLFYVAITRAKKYLHISYPLTAGFGTSFAGPSMFIDEIDKDLLDEYHIDGIGSLNSFIDPSDDVDDITYVVEENVGESLKGRRRLLKDIYEL